MSEQYLGFWDDVIGDVADNVPQFNDYLLKEFRKQEVSKSKQFMDMVYNEACAVKSYQGRIKYLGYRVLSPEERISFKIDNPLLKGQFDIQCSELELVEFKFEFEGEQYLVHLYLPYMFNDCITIGGTEYHIQLAIIERTIYRVREGVIIKVLRSPLHFWRNETISLKSENSDNIYHENIITVKAFHKKGAKTRKKDLKSTLLLYLLCQFGWDGVLKIFGLTNEDIFFSDHVEKDRDTYECFYCKPDIYLVIRKDKMQITTRRLAASVIYMLQFFPVGPESYTIEQLIDPEAKYWKVILGKCCYGMAVKAAMAINHAEPHLTSVSTLLDHMTRNSLLKMGIPCNDIFDMFYQVFINLDEWLVNHQPNNLYEKKIGVLESLLSEIVKNTFKKFYEQTKQQNNLNPKSVRKLLRLHNRAISRIYNNNIVRSNPSVYNDNWLLSIGGKKVRERANQFKSTRNANLLRSKEHLLHPSMVVVESITTIPTSSPGVGGSINPFCWIDEDGIILPTPWSPEVEVLAPYIPQ